MIKLPPFFSDNLVFQRDVDIKIFGLAEPTTAVTISFCGKEYTATSDDGGNWLCNLGRFPANSTPADMQIASGGETCAIHNILIGDVWLCTGQSNMELCLNRTAHNYPDEMTASNPLIRQLKVPQVYDFNGAIPPENMQSCAWETFTPDTAPNFTAAGYFFAKYLTAKYKIPVGLIASAVGGTPVAAWMDRDMLKNFPDDLAEADTCKDTELIQKTLQDYEIYTADYHKQLAAADLGLKERWAGADYDDSSGEWETIPLCKPVQGGAGAIWYRKTIDIPETLWGKSAIIFLGTCIDMDEVYINGEKLGATYYRYPPREYNFTLPSDKLTIAIRLLCFGDTGGGFTPGKNYFIATNQSTINIGGDWKRRRGAVYEPQKPQTFFQYKPTGLFNGMIMPLADYAIRGVIWYQGESDAGNPARYAEKLTAMIEGWRKLRNCADLPFIQTQLTHWDGGPNWDDLREQQKLCLTLPNTGLALAYDLGEHNDLHPLNKRDIGERLARIAMRVAYGEDLPPNAFEMY
ncbi:MAG: hypothetical protein FWH20_04475 [Oscillospiraceae bacterium]|nr:hypothetical protein [Oscillospiraceae bacterium]